MDDTDQQRLRRRLNDDRRLRFGESGRILALLCEADGECPDTVLLPVDAYDVLRPGPILCGRHEKSRLAAASEAAGQGFEPQLPDPESGVLPLDDPATAPPIVAPENGP
jgi:hypothetical protein